MEKKLIGIVGIEKRKKGNNYGLRVKIGREKKSASSGRFPATLGAGNLPSAFSFHEGYAGPHFGG